MLVAVILFPTSIALLSWVWSVQPAARFQRNGECSPKWFDPTGLLSAMRAPTSIAPKEGSDDRHTQFESYGEGAALVTG